MDRSRINECSVRVMGVKPEGNNPWCCTTYWAGAFTVQASDLMR